MLRTGINSLDAVLITHEHNDHIIGLDDVRPFNFMASKDMPVLATKRVCGEIKKRFAYIFEANPYPGAPRLLLEEINKETPFHIAGYDITPLEVIHGKLPVIGFRLGNFAYVTDAKTITPQEKEKLLGLDTLVLNALHHKPHHSHLNLEEALEWIRVLQPRQAYLTHISHRMGRYQEISKKLPEGINLAYDGLEIVISTEN